jgi:hypothetical protein
MACRLIVTLPVSARGVDVDAVYEDVGEMDAGSRAGLKALYSDARKRAGVATGIGAYLYTALAPVVLPIGPKDRQAQPIRRSGKPDTLTLTAATEQWLRHGYEQRMSTGAVTPRPRRNPRPRRTRARHGTRRSRRTAGRPGLLGRRGFHRAPPRGRTRRARRAVRRRATPRRLETASSPSSEASDATPPDPAGRKAPIVAGWF